MKLYEVRALYCDWDDVYLMVSDKTAEEIESDIHSKDKDGYLFHLTVREIDKVDGYNVILEKAI